MKMSVRKTSVESHNGRNDGDTARINNSTVMLKKLSGLLSSSEMSDLQLTVGNKMFNVHKLILCMSSEVLRVMFTNPQWPEFYQECIVLKEEPECDAVFDQFLLYLYSGRVDLTPDTVLPLLMLADKYGVTQLSQSCVDYMTNKTMYAIRSGCIVSWLRYSHLCGYYRLENTCQKMMMWNFRAVTVASDFITMQKEILFEFLKSSELVIHDEFYLFTAVKRWLIAQKTTNNSSALNFKNLLIEVMSLIRFPLIRLHSLRQLHLDELAKEAKEFFQEKITLGINYHTQPVDSRVAIESSSKTTHQYFPRNFTCEMWNTALTLENYSYMCDHMMRLMYFSSPPSASFDDNNLQWEWQMELYPKGILFGTSMMIGSQENVIVPQIEYELIRVAIKTETPERKHVEISVLVAAQDGHSEYIGHVVKKRFLFDKESTVCNIDNFIPYLALNGNQENSEYLIGENRDAFKVMLVIKPLDLR